MNLNCPICKAGCQSLRNMAFSEKANLPQHISFTVCGKCDFAFTSPRDKVSYRLFYSANVNDNLGADLNFTDAEMIRYSGQLENLQFIVDVNHSLRILDFGCGQAGLIRTLNRQYPHHAYFAVDPNVSDLQVADPDICFSADWKNLDGSFDLIILSHVIEHIADFDDIAQLTKRLTKSGYIYIEVPDASRYKNYLRREFLYYFDRLHINHFTGRSLRLLLSQWDFQVVNTGQSEFEYKDGCPYPAIYVIARCGLPNIDSPLDEPLQQTLEKYVASEKLRGQAIRKELKNFEPIVVYGYGDNFHKSIEVGGPLEGISIAAIIDKRNIELNLLSNLNNYRFMDIDSCCAAYPESAYVICVSWGNLVVHEALRDHSISNIFLI